MQIYTTNENKTYVHNVKIKAVNWVNMTKAREKSIPGPAFCQRHNEEKSSLPFQMNCFHFSEISGAILPHLDDCYCINDAGQEDYCDVNDAGQEPGYCEQ